MTSADLDADRIKRIFFPYMDRKTREFMAAGGRFVYYTTADTAMSILRNRQFWMRSTTTMNDYMEVEHGFECLNAAYKAEPGNIFNRSLDANANKFGHIRRVNTLLGFFVPTIVTPLELIGETATL
jgi:hypothetical protein